MPLGPGETFERYAVEASIGRGGMGEVYRALDTRLRRHVALKVIRPDKDRPDAVARLYREARAAAALSHPNAVALHDVGEAEAVFYIVMELVRGQPLLAYVGDARVPLAKKITWLTDIARALGAAHRAGIIHRDVKPSNVMVSEDGFAKVLDFGLARPLGPIDPVSFRTQEGRVLGTLRYMAPEQVAGAEADARSDQYAFGLTAYELLAGTHPGGAMFDTHPRRIDELVKEIPPEIASIVDRMLSRDPNERYASMDDVVHAFEATVFTQRAPAPHMTPALLEAAPEIDLAATDETMSALPTGLASLAEAGARENAEGAVPARPEATLITKEAPSALLRHRPIDKTLPLGAVPPASPSTLASGRPLAAPPAPAAAMTSTPPPRVPSLPAPASPAPARSGGHGATIAISVAVLAVAAFAGTYLGSRRMAQPGASTPTVSSASAAAAREEPSDPAPPPSSSARPAASASATGPKPKATAAGMVQTR